MNYKNPAFAYAEGLSKGRLEGCGSFALLCLLAGSNVCEDYMDEETFYRFFAAWEKEVRRMMTEEFHDDARDMCENVRFLTEKMRKEHGLEEL